MKQRVGWSLFAASIALACLVATNAGVDAAKARKRTVHGQVARPDSLPPREPWGMSDESPGPQQEAPPAINPFDRLGWLVGCWALEDDKRRVEEQWSSSGGVLMLASRREYTKPKLALHEEERARIEFRHGRYLYIAAPSTQPADTFVSVEVTERSIVFVDRNRDVPQRIGYEQLAPDSVRAWIEGMQTSEPRRVENSYHRDRCGQVPRSQ